MATKTLIRSKKKHQVTLEEGGQLAQSPHASEADTPVTAPPRKAAAVKRPAAAPAPAAGTKASPGTGPTNPRARSASAAPAVPTPTPARKRSSASAAASPATVRGRPDAAAKSPPPRLPARVPADGLWESDSAVMQRLQALVERNAQLAEQLQRLQPSRMPKGDTP